MHKYAKRFITEHADKLRGVVLEVGSLDVNGSIREIVDISVGVDMRPGKGVDLVCDVKHLPEHFKLGSFDACVSLDTLEHVEDWKTFCKVTWDMVKEGGWLVMSIASELKKYHPYPDDYIRLSKEQIKTIYPGAEVFDLGKVSYGWVVRKSGQINLDVEPLCPSR